MIRVHSFERLNKSINQLAIFGFIAYVLGQHPSSAPCIALSNAPMPPSTPSAVKVGKRCDPGTCTRDVLSESLISTTHDAIQLLK